MKVTKKEAKFIANAKIRNKAMGTRLIRPNIYELWRRCLPFIYAIILLHFLKDITQDILRIPTPLDLLGDVHEDISLFPKYAQLAFIAIGITSFIVEGFLLITIPYVLRTRAITKLEKMVIITLVGLLLYFLAVTLLDPRFKL